MGNIGSLNHASSVSLINQYLSVPKIPLSLSGNDGCPSLRGRHFGMQLTTTDLFTTI